MRLLPLVALSGIAFFSFQRGVACAGCMEKGSALYFAGHPHQALEQYERCASSSPSAASEAAYVLSDSGQPALSAKLLSEAVARFPGHDFLRPQLALAMLDAGDCRNAASLFSALVSSAPSDSVLYLRLGRAKFCIGDLPGAQSALAASLGLSQSSLAWYFMGRVMQSVGEAEQAVEAYRHVLELDSQFIEVRERLAELFLGRKDYNEAWRQYKKLGYADPKNDKIKKKAGSLASLITKKPEEILPPKVLRGFSQPASFVQTGGQQVLRIGIGTGSGGHTVKRGELAFSVSGAFSLVNAGAVIATGAPSETWTVKVSTASASKAELHSPSGFSSSFSGPLLVEPQASTCTIILRTLTIAEGTSWGGISDRELRGRLELRPDAERGIVAVNIVPLEAYLYGVLPAEMPWYYPLEALKAQAVLARTYSYNNRGKHSKQGYDLCDSQHCQVYEGVSAERKNPTAAVESTRGKILLFKGKPVEAVFSSNSGGMTASGAEAGWGDKPYWVPVSDLKDGVRPASPGQLEAFLSQEPKSYSSASVYVHGPSYRWQRVVAAKTVKERLAKGKKDIGRLLTAAVTERHASGRVRRVRLEGSAGSVVLEKENEIRKYLSAGLLRSTFFWMESVYDQAGALESLIFHGAGWGHGVGFCQAGSSGRAESGQDYKEILSHYYPGTKLQSIPSK